jgi:hypothetical protein
MRIKCEQHIETFLKCNYDLYDKVSHVIYPFLQQWPSSKIHRYLLKRHVGISVQCYIACDPRLNFSIVRDFHSFSSGVKNHSFEVDHDSLRFHQADD